MTRIDLRFSDHDSVATLELSGEFDLAAERYFDQRLREILSTESAHLVIDLRGLEFIDSTGLKQLLRVDELSKQDGFRLWLVGGQDESLRTVLRTTGLDAVLPLVAEPPALPD